jgi:NADPH-dependent dioxygenase
MFGKKKPQVLIVGAGPVGLFLALVLTKRGISVHIVDSEWRTGAHSYALALHPRSLQLLDRLGLVSEALEDAYRVRTVGLYDGNNRQAELRLAKLEDDFSFVAVIRQDRLERLLEDALRREGVKVMWNHRVSHLAQTRDAVQVTIDRLDKEYLGYPVAHSEWVVAKSREVDVPFVLGADGHNSLVRRALDIEFREMGETEYFAVFEFETDFDLYNEMRIVLADETTNVLWPLNNGRCRWTFQLTDFFAPASSREKDRFELQHAHLSVLGEENLRQYIVERAPWFDGQIGEIQWEMVVRFERRLASSFGSDGVWLAGDAAHLTGPVGVQSMNVGLREAWELGNAVADILVGAEDREQLSVYERERLAEWRFLHGTEGGLRPLMRTTSWLTGKLGRLLPCIPAAGYDLVQLAEQIGVGLRETDPEAEFLAAE